MRFSKMLKSGIRVGKSCDKIISNCDTGMALLELTPGYQKM